MKPPAIRPKPGWTAADPFWQWSPEQGFLSSDGSDGKLKLRYFRRKSDGALMARVWLGPASEGPPGHAHGGCLAAILDEALGAAAWACGLIVMTAKLTVRFRRMVPLGAIATVETSVHRAEKQRVIVSGRITDDRGRACVEAEGLFLKVPKAYWQSIFKKAAKASRAGGIP